MVCSSIAKNQCEYLFIGQSEKSMKAESWRRDIVNSIFPSINTSFFPNFLSPFYFHHPFQTMDAKPLFSIIYFFNTFPEVQSH